MTRLGSLRVGALALLTAASMAVPMHTTALASQAGSRVVLAGAAAQLDMTKAFSTHLQGDVVDKNKTVVGHVYLYVSKEADTTDDVSNGKHEPVDLVVSTSNAGYSSTGSYSFRVPSSAPVLTIAPKGQTKISSALPYYAVLDTGTILYDKSVPKNTIKNHIVIDWTYLSSKPITIAADPCHGTKASKLTEVQATATATIDLPYPCDGATGVTVSGTANLDSEYVSNVSESQDTVVYYASVSAIKYLSGLPSASSGGSKQPMTSLMVIGTKRGTTTTVTVGQSKSMNVEVGLQSVMQMASDNGAPASALTTGGGHVATLNYSGALGTADLVFDGTPSTSSTTGQCANANAAKSDLSKTVEEDQTQGTVSGPVDLKVCSAGIKTTYGTGDTGMVTVYQKPSAALSRTASGALPGGVFTKGSIPAIKSITPAPGATISPTQSVTVTFASALPAGSMVLINLTPTSGGTAQMLGPAMLTSGGTSQVSLTPKSALPSGTYKLQVTAMAGSANIEMYPSPMGGYQATYTVK